MVTENVLENLINNIEIIIELAKRRGFSDLKLFKPLISDYADKFHFMARIASSDADLFDLARLKNEIARAIGYEESVIILTENQFDLDGKARAIGESIPFTSENKQEIANFLEMNYKPISQNLYNPM